MPGEWKEFRGSSSVYYLSNFKFFNLLPKTGF